jgi:hypothetical protein
VGESGVGRLPYLTLAGTGKRKNAGHPHIPDCKIETTVVGNFWELLVKKAFTVTGAAVAIRHIARDCPRGAEALPLD